MARRSPSTKDHALRRVLDSVGGHLAAAASCVVLLLASCTPRASTVMLGRSAIDNPGATDPPVGPCNGDRDGRDGLAQPTEENGRDLPAGFYALVVPGIVQLPVLTRGYPSLRPTWAWGVGGGYHWRPTNAFRIAAGVEFDHSILRFAASDHSGNQFRFVAAARVGGGSDSVWGYGLLGIGPVVTAVDVPDAVADNLHLGAAVRLGAGLQGAIWRTLFVGVEPLVDLAFLGAAKQAVSLPGDPEPDFKSFAVWLRAVAGWHF